MASLLSLVVKSDAVGTASHPLATSADQVTLREVQQQMQLMQEVLTELVVESRKTQAKVDNLMIESRKHTSLFAEVLESQDEVNTQLEVMGPVQTKSKTTVLYFTGNETGRETDKHNKSLPSSRHLYV